jgi:hypothetical protein
LSEERRSGKKLHGNSGQGKTENGLGTYNLAAVSREAAFTAMKIRREESVAIAAAGPSYEKEREQFECN